MEHISSLRDAHQRYKDALTSVLAEFHAATGQNNNDLQLGIHRLNKQIEIFILACEDLMSFIHKKLPSTLLRLLDEYISSLRDVHQRFKDHLAAVLAGFNAAGGHHVTDIAMDLAILNLQEPHECFILACENFRAFIDLTVAPKEAPVIPDNAQSPPQAPADTRYGDEAAVSEERRMAVSPDLGGLNLNRLEPEETVVENNMGAPEETAEHKMTALQVLSDLDPNQKA